MKHVLAIDIGGTHIKAGLVSEESTLKQHHRVQTPKTFTGFKRCLVDLLNLYQDEDYIGVAVSSPGNPKKDGTIGASSALPYLHEHNIARAFTDVFDKKVTMENDANCCALSEIWSGNGQNEHRVATLIIGTGIGGALIENKKLVSGKHHHAGDFGYMLFLNEDGEHVVFSRLASTASFVRYVATRKNQPVEEITGEQVFSDAQKGDLICQEAIRRFYTFLSMGIYNIQYVYDPDLILIGGGISTRKTFISELTEHMEQMQSQCKEQLILPNVAICHHADHANLLGAAYHFLTS